MKELRVNFQPVQNLITIYMYEYVRQMGVHTYHEETNKNNRITKRCNENEWKM